jgi:hypothetical protein
MDRTTTLNKMKNNKWLVHITVNKGGLTPKRINTQEVSMICVVVYDSTWMPALNVYLTKRQSVHEYEGEISQIKFIFPSEFSFWNVSDCILIENSIINMRKFKKNSHSIHIHMCIHTAVASRTRIFRSSCFWNLEWMGGGMWLDHLLVNG